MSNTCYICFLIVFVYKAGMVFPASIVACFLMSQHPMLFSLIASLTHCLTQFSILLSPLQLCHYFETCIHFPHVEGKHIGLALAESMLKQARMAESMSPSQVRS